MNNVWEQLVTIASTRYEPDPQMLAWRADPALWARERLGAFLWSKQDEICAAVAVHRRTAVRSSHGVGKSWTAAMVACWWIDVHPPGEAIIVSTAPTARQVSAILWEEIRKQHKKGKLQGKVNLNDEWKIESVLVGMGRKPADHDEHGFQGIHRKYVLVIMDEACGIPQQLYTSAEAITTNQFCRILAIGNPDDPGTEFGRVCKPGSGWHVIGISSFDSPNFTGEDVPQELRYLLPSEDWVEDAAKRWGTSSPLYTSKVLGEFPEIGDNTLISPKWIVAAQQREMPPFGMQSLGVDVARYGTDSTVIVHRLGGRARVVYKAGLGSTTSTTGQVVKLTRELGPMDIHVDGVGVGGGVHDQLEEMGYATHDMQSGGAPYDSERFKNARAEWFWGLRERFEQGDIDLDPDDDDLASQLGSLRFSYTSRAQIIIESKDDMKKRGMPSPDDADALMLAFANPNMNSNTIGGM